MKADSLKKKMQMLHEERESKVGRKREWGGFNYLRKAEKQRLRFRIQERPTRPLACVRPLGAAGNQPVPESFNPARLLRNMGPGCGACTSQGRRERHSHASDEIKRMARRTGALEHWSTAAAAGPQLCR